LERVARDQAGARKDGRVGIVSRIAPRPLMLWGDSMLLEQAMHNVVRNSLEAMPEGGSLGIETEALSVRGQERVLARVTDSGVGIPPHQLERLFQPFYTTKPQGTGLGLSLARKYLRAHGGDIRVHTAPGKGTRVEMVLPVAGPAPETGNA
jgi:signal transduction histidine kinase